MEYSHWPVVVDTVVSVVVLLIGALINTPAIVNPTQRTFVASDTTISQKQREDTVSNAVLFLIVYFLPAFLMIAINITFGRFRARKRRRVAWRLLGLLQCVAVTLVFTGAAKMTLGELRPDFLDRCKPAPAGCTTECICTGDPDTVNEGRLAFPSGHASLSFTGMVYLSLYIAYELNLLNVHPFDASPVVRRIDHLADPGDSNDAHQSRFLMAKREFHRSTHSMLFTRYFFSVCPLVIAVMVALSRVIDNKHHPHDVVFGGILGTLVAVSIFYLKHANMDFGETLAGMRGKWWALQLNRCPAWCPGCNEGTAEHPACPACSGRGDSHIHPVRDEDGNLIELPDRHKNV